MKKWRELPHLVLCNLGICVNSHYQLGSHCLCLSQSQMKSKDVTFFFFIQQQIFFCLFQMAVASQTRAAPVGENWRGQSEPCRSSHHTKLAPQNLPFCNERVISIFFQIELKLSILNISILDQFPPQASSYFSPYNGDFQPKSANKDEIHFPNQMNGRKARMANQN